MRRSLDRHSLTRELRPQNVRACVRACVRVRVYTEGMSCYANKTDTEVPGSIPGLQDFVRSNGSETESSQPCKYN
jgi:hypothetical protein